MPSILFRRQHKTNQKRLDNHRQLILLLQELSALVILTERKYKHKLYERLQINQLV